MILNILRHSKMKKQALATFTLTLLLGCAIVPPSENGNANRDPVAQEAAVSSPPFARVSLALRGCSSCSHCRSTIRQTAKGAAEGASVRVGGDNVEIRFEKPQTLSLREIVQRLANNGLHDLSVLDVLLDAEGKVETANDGKLVFHLNGTEQLLPIQISPSLDQPPQNQLLRLRAVVKNWEKDQELSLDFKYLL